MDSFYCFNVVQYIIKDLLVKINVKIKYILKLLLYEKLIA